MRPNSRYYEPLIRQQISCCKLTKDIVRILERCVYILFDVEEVGVVLGEAVPHPLMYTCVHDNCSGVYDVIGIVARLPSKITS